MAIPRYSMMGTPGGYREVESARGEYVRVTDVKQLLRVYFLENPEEYDVKYEHLFTAEEIQNMSQSLRGEA